MATTFPNAITAEQLAASMPSATELLSDEPEMESSLHALQLRLLVTILEWYWRDRNDFFIGDNLTVYYSRQQLKTRDFRGPDFFVVTGTTRRHRTSWVVWEEGRFPDLIIELLSDSTAEIDRKIKREIYGHQFHTPEYFWFYPQTEEFIGFRLIGNDYQEIQPDAQGRRWSEVLHLYLGIHQHHLRYFTADGSLVPTPDEAATAAISAAEREMRRAEHEAQRAEHEAQRAEHEAQRAEHEAQRAEHESQRAEHEAARADKLAARLRELGIDPNQI